MSSSFAMYSVHWITFYILFLHFRTWNHNFLWLTICSEAYLNPLTFWISTHAPWTNCRARCNIKSCLFLLFHLKCICQQNSKDKKDRKICQKSHSLLGWGQNPQICFKVLNCQNLLKVQKLCKTFLNRSNFYS